MLIGNKNSLWGKKVDNFKLVLKTTSTSAIWTVPSIETNTLTNYKIIDNNTLEIIKEGACNNGTQLTADLSASSGDCSIYLELDENGNDIIRFYIYSLNIYYFDPSFTPQLQIIRAYLNQIVNLDMNGFLSLTELTIYNNQLTTLDVSGCVVLNQLYCYSNLLTSLNIDGCILLSNLRINNNKLTSLDTSTNIAISTFNCYSNNLLSLNLVNNIALKSFAAYLNKFTSLNAKNGTNTIITKFDIRFNYVLPCVLVDDAVYSTTNWTLKQATTSYSDTTCP